MTIADNLAKIRPFVEAAVEAERAFVALSPEQRDGLPAGLRGALEALRYAALPVDGP